MQCDECGEQGGDGHQQRYGDAESAGEGVGGAEADHGGKRGDGEGPVDQRYVDLADLVNGGVHYV